MRQGRLKVSPQQPYGVYHCFNSVINQWKALSDTEKEHMVCALRRAEVLCGVQILTFLVLDNHFHLLVLVPRRPEVLPTPQELLERLKPVVSPLRWQRVQRQMQQLRAPEHAAELGAYLETFFRRMWDVSQFLKTFKESFSQGFNQRHDRVGPLWRSRFCSVIVQGESQALGATAAYIDLNGVRAGVTPDPATYRWSGYAQAMAGNPQALEGIRWIMASLPQGQGLDARQALEAYRVLLHQTGAPQREALAPDGRPLRGVLSQEQVMEVLQNKGRVGLAEYVRCRVSYFAHGVVLGSRGFVEEVFEQEREKFGKRRKQGAVRMEGLEEELYSTELYKPGVFG